MEFKLFKTAVAEQFQRMVQMNVPFFYTKVDKDRMWQTYLDSFPDGTNPIYRERREYDCSACRQFVRAVGNVVIVRDNELVSIWDITVNEPTYQTVANAMSLLVKAEPIENVFISTEPHAGVDKNFEQLTDGSKTWNHFYITLPRHVVVRSERKGTQQSEARANKDVFLRSLQELTDDSVDTVLELITQNSLYRGDEHKAVLLKFKEVKLALRSVSAGKEDMFAWTQSIGLSGAVAKIRNTAIGTLLIDLSAGIDLESAVRKYETLVAPANYKRPTALVTQAMIESARKKVEELGLTSALGRRYAQLSDISVNDILFVDRESKKNLSDNVFDDIAATAPAKRGSYDKVEEVPIEKFLRDVMPTATSLEVMVENSHIKNMVSLVAPTDPTAESLFKWGNKFSWAYNGDMADSVKEKVKAAGGNVTGDLCCRLAWYNYDDLDLHMVEPPPYSTHIYYNHRFSASTHGQLDVDMNAGGGKSRTPVENIFYRNREQMREGVYHLYVKQYMQRESKDIGFEVEIDFMGDLKHFAYNNVVRGSVTVAKFKYSHAGGIEIIESLPASTATKEVWGINTSTFQKVNLVMLSPNHWESSGSGVGNKHYFFMLDGCQNPDSARGFFNEFLRESLNEHRKVFELVGSKMQTEPSTSQLSGLGFSNTMRNHVLCRVGGAFNRVVKITF